MTAQATPSSNALGRHSVPSSFFAPPQIPGRSRERQKSDGNDADTGTNSEGSIESPAEAMRENQFEAQFETQLEGWTAGPLSGPAHDDSDFNSSLKAERDQQYGRVWSLAPNLAPNLNPNLNPDPEAVRGAIARLAREARATGARDSQSSPPVAAPPPVTPEAAFADVARRVWSEGVAGTASPGGAPPASRWRGRVRR